MARIVKPLSPVQVRNAKPKDKTYRLFDGGGLYLSVYPHGGKLWHMKVKQDGKENILSFGKYPDVSLDQARQYREDARKLKASGINPVQAKKDQKEAVKKAAANTFELVAREWYDKQRHTWADRTAHNIMTRLEADIFPWIGRRPVADITASEYLDVLRRIEERGAIETAHRAKTICSQVQRYAIASGRASSDPTVSLRGALTTPKAKHFAAVTEPKQVAELLRMIDAYDGTLTVACALQLAPLVFVRPGELRAARWADIDLDKSEWRYTISKTKTEHIVPLSRQAVSIFQRLHPLTGHGEYVFPGARTNGRPMSDNAINAALRRLGIGKDEMTGHGFRAMARTILDEVLGVRPDLIEHQLAHTVKDPLGRAYNRTAHLPERKKMMQQWADYLDKIKVGAEIISLRGNAA